ncbi:oxygen-independent coproporphyrinogen III oxidase [Limimaricola pyoseonensis]|uniref:Coproporphyrinogen-III oxidase n=1 Tax=Limimaricola pyoseonensis TaxID=521013 RepID=A0A1G7CCZ0_9RHOB|nr:oxygen-independent coproporphyrinogen III oxidase [Limimaricola pyoseonensis]SDE37197.1 oxygen-independent coproporphyrinogen-3 oxidase [Limimaricola pyoseonensis]
MTHDPLKTRLLEARVPRYTSFPPANRFGPEVGPDQMAQWLGATPPGAPVSLYIHVPFCRRLCWFCACRTQGARSDEPIDRYLDHLAIEIGLVRDRLPRDVATTALHLGGGTPTLLSPDRMDRLAAMVEDAFPAHPGREVSVEIDPCECDGARLDKLMEIGLTRASIGVQDFDREVQSAIGRHQSAARTARIVEGLRERGVGGINFDLLYGLPHQTEAKLADTLRQVLEMRPDRIALYGYAHVPWMARRQRLISESTLPDATERLGLSALARDALLANGYVEIGIDHYALAGDSLAQAERSGRLHRNFQGYTTDATERLIGLGPSAISRFPQGYAQNQAATGAWQDRLAGATLATARGHVMSKTDRAIAFIIERIMCEGRVDLRGGQDDPDMLERTLPLARRAIEEFPGIARLDGPVLQAGSREYWRLLASVFDTEYEDSAGRYSMAS